MITLQEIVQGDYAFFSNFGEKEREAQKATCKYLEFLSSTSRVPIDKWDIVKIFGTSSRAQKKLITDKTEINKRFFQYNKELQEALKDGEEDKIEEVVEEDKIEEVEEEKKEETEEEIKALKDLAIEAVKEKKNEIKNDLERLLENREPIKERLQETTDKWIQNIIEDRKQELRRANEYYSQYLERMRKATQKQQTIYNAEHCDNNERMFNEFKGVCEKGFWKYYRLYRNKITFTTASDVVIKHVNPAAKLNLQVNLGSYLCAIDLNTLNITVRPFRNNLETSGNYHPFISSDGNPCWGNSQETANDLIHQKRITEIMELLGSLLSTYMDEATPYVNIQEFANLDKNENRITTVSEEDEKKSKSAAASDRSNDETPRNISHEDLQQMMNSDPSGNELFNAVAGSLANSGEEL